MEIIITLDSGIDTLHHPFPTPTSIIFLKMHTKNLLILDQLRNKPNQNKNVSREEGINCEFAFLRRKNTVCFTSFTIANSLNKITVNVF